MENNAPAKLISVIVPVYNEEANIPGFFSALSEVLKGMSSYEWEIIFVNDGSTDGTAAALEKLADSRVASLEFSRNFGKEAALTAGLNKARGDAVLMIDADLQHPVSLIPEFLRRWETGIEVVIGLRSKNRGSFLKRLGSYLFYRIIRTISSVKLMPSETDFRLLDRAVIDAFNRLPETNRMTRALIDWLGFRRDYISFEPDERARGSASYSLGKLIRLAFNSFVSLSLIPLRLAGYLGVLIIMTAGPLGLYILIGKYLADWKFASSFSGPAQLAILITFLVGIVLTSLGLVALYIAHIHAEVLGRPLYILRDKKKE